MSIMVVLCMLAVTGCGSASNSFTYVDPNPPASAGTSSSVRNPLVTYGADTVHDAVVIAELTAYLTAVPIVTANGQTAAASAWTDDLVAHELRYVSGALAVKDPTLLIKLTASSTSLTQVLAATPSQAQVTTATQQIIAHLQHARAILIPLAAHEDDAFRAAVIDGILSDMIITDQTGEASLATSDYLRIWANVTALQTSLLQDVGESARAGIRTQLDQIAQSDTSGPEAPASFDAERVGERLSEIIDDNAAAARIDVAPPGPATNAAGALKLMERAVQRASEQVASNNQRAVQSSLATARTELAVAAPSIVTLDPDTLTQLRLLVGQEIPAAMTAQLAHASTPQDITAVLAQLETAADAATSAIEQELALRRMADAAT